ITRRLVPDKGHLPIQPVRGAVQRLLPNGGDEICDRPVVDRLRVNSLGTRIARETREAQVRPFMREPREELAPGWREAALGRVGPGNCRVGPGNCPPSLSQIRT